MSAFWDTLHFVRPDWLWALLLLPVALLGAGYRRRRGGDWRDAVDPHLLPHLLVGRGRRGIGGGLALLIAPGAFQSDMNKAARDHGDAVAKSIPTKRIGVPEDMAGAAIFLASKAGDYVVGETIAVDGGLVHGDLKTSIDA